MPNRGFVAEFRRQYENTKFPFLDNATLVARNKTATIDEDIFLDASLFPIGATGYVYLSEVIVAERSVRVAFADGSRREKCFTEFDPLDNDGVLRVADEWGRPAGILVSEPDKLARFATWESGTHTFVAAATTFVPAAVIPTPEVGVRGFLTEQGELLTGEVLLVGDNGVVVRQPTPDDPTIRIDIVGDPLFLRNLCHPVELFATPRPIQTINGCPPDKNGHFNLTIGDHYADKTVLRMVKTDAGLQIKAVGTTQE